MLVCAPSYALTEWTQHRTNDGVHPNANEQQLMWLMNRARANPSREGEWLASSTHVDLAFPRDYFRVNLSQLRGAFNGIAARPPAAFDARLYRAALSHAQDMVRRDAQDHAGQIERVKDEGYRYSRYRGNVFSYATSALNAHAAFNIDWGPGPYGMQDPAGHRFGLMAIDSQYPSVGMSMIRESNTATEVGEYVVVQNFGQALNSAVADGDHFNEYVVGTVWVDNNDNNQYDPGEGVEGVVVTPSVGDYYAVTSRGGGYAFPITDRGSAKISFSGGGIATYSRTINLANKSVLVDYLAATGPSESDPSITEPATPDTASLAVGVTDTGKYGRKFGSDRNPISLIARFNGTSQDLMLSALGYDVDTSREIQVRLNGRLLGNLLKGKNRELQGNNRFSIPAVLQKDGENEIEFSSTDSTWGVTNILLRDVTGATLQLPAARDNSFMHGWNYGSKGHRTVLRTRFYSPGAIAHDIIARGYHLTAKDMVAVYVNGRLAGHLKQGAKLKLTGVSRFRIAANQINPGVNEVEFVMKLKPNRRWGVAQARFKPRL